MEFVCKDQSYPFVELDNNTYFNSLQDKTRKMFSKGKGYTPSRTYTFVKDVLNYLAAYVELREDERYDHPDKMTSICHGEYQGKQLKTFSKVIRDKKRVET